MNHHAESYAASKGEPHCLRRCPQCNAWKMESEPYCPCCGTGRRTVCSRCGAETGHAIAFYCPSCGGQYEAEQSNS